MNIYYEINALKKSNIIASLQNYCQTKILQKFMDNHFNISSPHFRKEIIQQPKPEKFFEFSEKIIEINELLEKNCFTMSVQLNLKDYIKGY